jgi:hypothetical protein
MHTMGFPLRMEEFGGGFIYSMPEGRLAVGFVCGLDYQDPMFDPHVRFQHFKRHPLIASMLEGATLVRYGAKALPEGGWYTIPKTYAAGVLIAGEYPEAAKMSVAPKAASRRPGKSRENPHAASAIAATTGRSRSGPHPITP